MIEATSAVQTDGSNKLTASDGQQQKSQFLQLLVAQLKGQDPMNPMDGTQFASQLAQFSSLEELINIREVMEDVDGTLQTQLTAMEEANQEEAEAEVSAPPFLGYSDAV